MTAPTTLTVWNVSIVLTPDDNGFCVSFDNEADALACARNARENGAWHVSVWK